MSGKLYLYRRKNGIYYVGYNQDGRKVWQSTRARRRTDAIAASRELEAHLRQRHAEKMFAEFSQEFLAHSRTMLRPKTVEVYERAFRHFAAMHNDLPLSALTLKHIDE